MKAYASNHEYVIIHGTTQPEDMFKLSISCPTEFLVLVGREGYVL